MSENKLERRKKLEFEVNLKRIKDINSLETDKKKVFFWITARETGEDKKLGNNFAIEAKLVSLTKFDKTYFAKAYAPNPADKTEWPSGLEATQCFMCKKRPSEGILAIRQIVKKIGPEGKKKNSYTSYAIHLLFSLL